MLGQGWQALQAKAAVRQVLQSQGRNRQALESVTDEGMTMAALQKPFVQFVPPVRALGYVSEPAREAFLEAIFEMVPSEPSDTPLTTSAPAPAEAVRLVEVPSALSVAVAQRVGYTPAYEEDYQEQRKSLMRVLSMIDRHEALWKWMDPVEIETRTGLKRVRSGQTE